MALALDLLQQTGQVSTLAGQAAAGLVDAPGSAARFNAPSGLALAPQGFYVVADTNNNCLRKVSVTGEVQTWVGQAAAGSADGDLTQASFNHPTALAYGPDGTLYVADTENGLIRTVSPQGRVATLAGVALSAGWRDGLASQSLFRRPQGLAVDGQGLVYVSDTDNQVIRTIDRSAQVHTLAGSPGLPGSDDGPGTQARFHTPLGLAIARDGSVAVADSANGAVRKLTPGGSVTTQTWGWQGGDAGSTWFDHPTGLCYFGSALIVADTGNHAVRAYLATARTVTLAGTAGGFADGSVAAAMFNGPTAVAVDALGRILVVDRLNQRLRKIE